MRGTTAAAVVAAVAAAGLVFAGCQVSPGDNEGGAGADTVDCDAEDMRKHERDCGYWRADGTFETWDWVSGGGTSYAPYGWSPRLPSGGSWTRPTRTPGKVVTSRQSPPPTPTTRTSTRKTSSTRSAGGGPTADGKTPKATPRATPNRTPRVGRTS